jgi:acyl-CoA synthetase (AMP-forming)/AMP-acid ligase II
MLKNNIFKKFLLYIFNNFHNQMKASEIGEITAQRGNIMKGYLNDPEGTTPVPKNDLLFIGNFATIDDDGFIFVHMAGQRILCLNTGYNYSGRISIQRKRS